MSALGNKVPAFGPINSKVILIGEAPGREEDEQLRPFVGPAGQELRRMLRHVGLGLDDLYRTNVFSQRPPDNDLAVGYGVPKDHPNACVSLGALTSKPVVTYLHSAHVHNLQRLYDEITAVNPNVIVPLGNTACWALGMGHGIGDMRGTVHHIEVNGKLYKVLPTYHPSAVVRQWDLRTIAITDLEKAHQEAATPDLQFDNTELWLEPSLADLDDFGQRYLAPAHECAFDVETKQGQITCLSFAPSVDVCIVIPFWVEGTNPNYWPTVADETRAWRWVQHWVEKPSLVKVTQNGLYDTTYLRTPHSMNPANFSEDTMLASHSMYSEMRKGLGMLGSIYTNSPSWKRMRTFRREELLKRDD